MKKISCLTLIFVASWVSANRQTVELFYDAITASPNLMATSCDDFSGFPENTTCYIVQDTTFDGYLAIQEARDTFNITTFRGQGWQRQTINVDFQLYTNTYWSNDDYLWVGFLQLTRNIAVVFLRLGNSAQ